MFGTDPDSSATPDITPDSVAASSGAGSTPDSTQAPPVTDFTDDHLVRIPGQKDPVKYGELYKRLQADHTRKTQEAAQLKAQYDRERQDWEGRRRQEEDQLKSVATELLRMRNGNQNGGNDFISKLSQMQYVDGATAAQMFQGIQQEMFAPLQSALAERDQIITGMYKQMLGMNKTIQSMNGRFGSQDFEGKITRWVSELGLPQEATDLAKELYLAYEGDDLDQEFPTILQNRWNSLQALFRGEQQKRVTAARQAPFGIPGKGGTGAAGKPAGLTGRESARDTADALWEQMQATNQS